VDGRILDPDSLPDGGHVNNATSINLDAQQFRYARHIVYAALDRDLPKRAAVIAVAVALAESTLRMYANAANPASLDLPHDRVGSAHAAVGLFQQQVGDAPNSTADWGTTKELMDPEISCDKFLTALTRTDWRTGPNWAAAQDVQNSAYDGNPRPANNWSGVYGGNYRDQDDLAAQIVNAIWSGAAVSRSTDDPPRYWADTFERAPVFDKPGGASPTGTLYRGRNYVYGKRWGADVKTARGHNHWWLRTDPDEGEGSWVSAYFLAHWGDDEARDNSGHPIPNC
jgi:hypothetical protein